MKGARGEHDVEACADPFCLVAGAREIFEGLRLLLVDADDNRGGWRDVMRDPTTRQIVLDQLAYAGEHLARVTSIVTEIPEAPTQRELLELDVMQAALEIESARAEMAQRSSGPPR